MKKKPLEYALYLLEMRDRGIAEIRDKMTRKEYDPAEIDKAITFLLDKDFLNDERFTENYIKDRHSRGQGSFKIKFSLQRLGIERDLIDKKIALIEPDGEQEKAKELALNFLKKKKIKLTGDETPYQIRQKKYDKLGRFLISRGYSLDIVKKVLDETLK